MDGVRVGQVVRDDPAQPIDVRWPLVPGADHLNAVIEAWARDLASSFIRESSPDADTPPELNIGWTIPLAAGTVVGVEMDRYVLTGTERAQSRRTYYSDVVASSVWRGRDLFTGTGLTAAAAVVASALKTAGRTVFTDLLEDPDQVSATFDDVHFEPLGGVSITVSEGALGMIDGTMATVRIPDRIAEPWLSPAGRAVRDAVRSGSPYTYGGATPTATRTSSTAATSPGSSSPPPAAGAAVDCAVATCVALTFDDGPGPETGALLDILAREKVHATFFLLGRNLPAHPEFVRREAAEGHAIGNHTWSHRDLSRLSAADQASEVTRTATALAELGVSTSMVRPPYGAYAASTRALGAALVLWSVDPLDWRDRDPKIITARVLADARPGGIVLLHDIHPTTVAAMPAIISGLRAKGYTFVTVPELVGPLAPGKAYYRRGLVK
jgi:peptidoglycan/xylan/chitin deacetylase (PgdA/CDA1 family)